MEQVVEMVKGEKKTTKRKFFPGYILVQMEMNDRTWHLVKNTPKVTGFVGAASTTEQPPRRPRRPRWRGSPRQISEGTLKPKPKVQFEEGDQVRVIDGPFSNFNGTVEEVNPDKGRVRVLVSHLRPRHPGRARLHAGGEDRYRGVLARCERPRQVQAWPTAVGGRQTLPARTTTEVRSGMKKITGQVKLQIPAGKANPRRPSARRSASTASTSWSSASSSTRRPRRRRRSDLIIPVVITVYRRPLVHLHPEDAAGGGASQEGGGAAHREEEGLGRAQARQGEGRPGHQEAGRGDRQAEDAATSPRASLEAAMRTIEGTARSMGIDIVG